MPRKKALPERPGIPQRRERFSKKEQALISPFVTNMDRSVFALRSLPQVISGTLFSRYSRTAKTLRQILLTEYIQNPDLLMEQLTKDGGDRVGLNIERAKDFYRRILAGYGDDSIAELGYAHLACEDVSNIAAKALQRPRIGLSFLEKSSRYVFFDEKVAGRYRYYREPWIMSSPYLRRQYEETLDRLFDTYKSFIDPMMGYLQALRPLEKFEIEDPKTGKKIPYKKLEDEALKKQAEFSYKFWNRSTAADTIRGVLPAATLTNMGIGGNGRAFEYLLLKLYSSELPEMQDLAPLMHSELENALPAFLDRAADDKGELFQNFLRERAGLTEQLAQEVLSADKPQKGKPVQLVWYDKKAEERVLALMLYPFAGHPLPQLAKIVRNMSGEQRRELLDAYCGGRKNRRHKPGRALEASYYLFDLEGNFGIYRDLQRQRMLTQERQLLSCDLGYDTSPLIAEAGLEKPYRQALERAADLYYKVARRSRLAAQYVVPFAYRVRWHMMLNLREAFHMLELRTIPEAHPDYATLCQEMYLQIRKVHPTLSQYMNYVNLAPRREASGRFEAAMRTQEKLKKLGGGAPKYD